MLISLEDWIKFCEAKAIKGIIHIGAHNCEEQPIYDKINIDKTKVIWIDAIQECVDNSKKLGFNSYQMVVSDTDDEECVFKITNNGESSSMLELDTHLQYYPYIHVVEERKLKTSRMDTFIKNNNVDMNNYNFLNMDIQGAELMALKGFGDNLKYIDYIYTEVNIEPLYKDCALLHEIDAYLATYGFKRKLTSMTFANWGDALYIKY
jgi:FkbM family methyltransferase